MCRTVWRRGQSRNQSVDARRVHCEILYRQCNLDIKRAVAAGCTIPELHVNVQPGSDKFDFVSIAIMAKSGYPGRLLEEERFLFCINSLT